MRELRGRSKKPLWDLLAAAFRRFLPARSTLARFRCKLSLGHLAYFPRFPVILLALYIVPPAEEALTALKRENVYTYAFEGETNDIIPGGVPCVDPLHS